MLLRSPLALLFLAAPLSAQVDLYGAPVHVEWPAGIEPAATHRMVAGDVTGDEQPDLVLVNGSTLVMAYAPAVYRSVFELGVEANDIVLLPHPTPGQAQRPMVVNDYGLHELGGYDAGDFDVNTLSFTGAEDWEGATRVTRGDTDGDGSLDLVGLSAGGDLLFLEDIDTAPNHTLLAVGPTILDFAPLDWTGSGTMAVARLQSNGFRVVTKSGTVLYSMPGTPESGFVLPIRQEGFGRDRCVVVWVYAGERYLAVVDSTNLETPIEMNTFDLCGAAVADVNGDGDEDLYLVSATSHTSKLLINRYATESFTYALDVENCESITLASGSPPLGATPWPVACDLSLDGDVDLALFLAASEDFGLLESQSLSVSAAQPTDPGGAFLHDEVANTGELLFTFEVSGGLPFTPSDLEVTAYAMSWQEEVEAWVVDPAAFFHGFSSVQPNDTATTHVEAPMALWNSSLVVVEVRWVDKDPTYGVVQAGPSAIYYFAWTKNLSDQLELLTGEEGEDVRPIIIPEPPEEPYELTPAQAVEREVAPKEVPAPIAPPMPIPPDPYP